MDQDLLKYSLEWVEENLLYNGKICLPLTEVLNLGAWRTRVIPCH